MDHQKKGVRRQPISPQTAYQSEKINDTDQDEQSDMKMKKQKKKKEKKLSSFRSADA